MSIRILLATGAAVTVATVGLIDTNSSAARTVLSHGHSHLVLDRIEGRPGETIKVKAHLFACETASVAGLTVYFSVHDGVHEQPLSSVLTDDHGVAHLEWMIPLAAQQHQHVVLAHYLQPKQPLPGHVLPPSAHASQPVVVLRR